MTSRVVVVGGGLAGCSAAAAAAKAGCEVVLIEKTDQLGGCALFAGHVDHRYRIVKEEMNALGCDDALAVLERCKIHDDVQFTFPDKALTAASSYSETKWFIYDVTKFHKAFADHLTALGVDIRLQTRVKDVTTKGPRVESVVLDDDSAIAAGGVVDATGGAGTVDECSQYGHGCVMCFFRCPSFGDRVSVAEKAGAKELQGRKRDGSIGPISSAYSLVKHSIAPELRERIERDGYVVIPVPPEAVDTSALQSITASGNIDMAWVENAVLTDIGGYAKRTAAGYTPLSQIRKIPGLENALYADPTGGSLGNAVRFMAVSPRDDSLRVPPTDNVFAAGEKLGVNGLGEVSANGMLAGHNAARAAAGKKLLVLPRTTIIGDFISYVNERWDKEGLADRSHFFLGTYWRRIKEVPELCTTDVSAIRGRIDAAGLTNVLAQKVS